MEILKANVKNARKGIVSQKAFSPVERLSNTSYFYIRGIDYTDMRMICRDNNSGALIQSENFTSAAPTWSSNKLRPANSSADGRINRFKDYLYYIGEDVTDNNKVKIWRALPQAENIQFDWGSPVHTLTAGCIMPKTCATSNDNYMFVGEYGDPSPDPHIWRSADGLTWESCWTSETAKHVHDVRVDSYTGYVWATIGDNCEGSVIMSKDNGNSWNVIVQEDYWQSVQISFDQNYVYLGGDSINSRANVNVIEKTTGKIFIASLNATNTYPVPGATPYSHGYLTSGANPATDLSSGTSNSSFAIAIDGDKSPKTVNITLANCTTGAATAAELQSKIQALGGVYQGVTVVYTNNTYVVSSPTKGNISSVRFNFQYTGEVIGRLKLNQAYGAVHTDGKSESFPYLAYWGIVDPNTGIYYCVTTDAANPSERFGLFYLPYVGGQLILLDLLPNDFNAGYQMYIAGNYLYFGQYRRPLLTLVDI